MPNTGFLYSVFFCFPHFSCKKERLAALLSVKEIYKF